MRFTNLTNNNVLLYAAKNYTNVNSVSTDEFYDDFSRLIYLKKIFIKYTKTGEIKERLVYNHLIVLYNVFNAGAITRILFLKLNDQLHILKPFLVLINRLPETVYCINNQNIHTSDIHMDGEIVKRLRQMKYEYKNQ